MSSDTGLDRLATLVQKLMMYSSSGFNTHAQALALLNTRLSIIEDKLRAEGAVSVADELKVKRATRKAEEAHVGYQAASEELFDYVERLSR